MSEKCSLKLNNHTSIAEYGGKSSQSNPRGSSDKGRETWSSNAEFVLTCIGYAVGLGNIWRFPYLCYKNGGGAFLVPYMLTILLCGLPLACLEFSIGQYTGLGMMSVWNICPMFKGLGTCFLMLNIVISFYFIYVHALCLHYWLDSFLPELPWIGCHHSWNTKACYDPAVEAVSKNLTVEQSGTFICNNEWNATETNLSRITPAEEYMTNYVLKLSSGIDEIGSVRWKLWLSLAIVWLMIYLATVRGVKSFGKVVYFTSTVPYVLLSILLIRGLFLPGSLTGITYYLIPKWELLMEAKVWYSALQQVFYSQGVSLGCFITMSSFNDFNNNCIRDAVIAVIVNSLTSLFAGFAIFSVLGFMAAESCQPIDQVIHAGPGLAFIAYPRALAALPLPRLWSVIFFTMLCVVGLSSQAVHFETLLTCITDHYPALRPAKRRILVAAGVVVVFLALGTVFTTEGGMYIFQLFDWFSTPIVMLIAAVLQCCIISWLYGISNLSEDIYLMIGQYPNIFLKVCWMFVTPAFLTVILIMNICTWTGVSYRGYTYSTLANTVGWMITMVLLLPIPITAIYKFIGNKTQMKMRIRALTSPSESFVVHTNERRLAYCHETPLQMKLIEVKSDS